jgi:hypothetical protein
MSLLPSLAIALTLLATPLLAQSTSISPAESALISSALASYEASLLHGPVATSLGIEVAFAIPVSEFSSFASNVESLVPFPSTDQYSFATAPPVTNLATPAWAMTLPTSVQSDLISLRSSVVLAEASLVRGVLSITATPSIAIATASATVSMSAAATISTGSSDAGAVRLGRREVCLSMAAMVAAVGFVVVL